ncbi:uncharacterized protein LOC134259504 [Saccostrea cucullata]|uniref:uncharacterized protein LOC134259504 n=1 Tax=Saccostrea cuccullata TaxID=36930 RepID=UPI002ED367B9
MEITAFWSVKFLFFSYLVHISQSAEETGDDFHAQTRLGAIVGKRFKSYNNQGTLYKFLNIPFAKAPVNHLRFAKPIPYGAWSGTLNATNVGPACYQTVTDLAKNFKFSEDCLQLNIYVPNNFNPSNKKSVMVWIHGGGYLMGSGLSYDGGFLALNGDVIVVTINYRLGIFGFLASGDYRAKGNMGLWDQILALNWVRYNIHDYGGNPRDVTIFGESAGGFSVSLLALIPNNRGLFHRVIMESGVASSQFATVNASLSTIKTAEKVGCVYDTLSTSDAAFLRCLRNIDPMKLVNATDEFITDLGLRGISQTIFAPTIDGELFRREPALLLQDKSSSEFTFFQSLDVMIGNCENEGSVIVGAFPFLQDELPFNISNGVPPAEMCKVFLPNLLNEKMKSNTQVFKDVCDMYTVKENDEAEQGRQFLSLISDYLFLNPSTSTLLKHSNNVQASSTYQYVFFDELSFMLPNAPSWYRGSAHATELIYLFYYEQLVSRVKYPKGAEILVNQMRSYWTNFAKTGNPNGPGLPVWLPYDRNSSHPYMSFRSLNTGMGLDYRKDYMEFWMNKIPAMLSEPDCDQNSCALPVMALLLGYKFLLFSLMMPFSQSADETGNDFHAQTRLGTIVGKRFNSYENQGTVYKFLNIPFAKAPVGHLRFSKPLPYGAWSGTLNATNFGPSCYQNDKRFKLSEDCLQLNIYVPNDFNPSNRKSVMVWIHGGGYIIGSGIPYDGSFLALKGDVIVVTINYRLGIFGFLASNDYRAKGNMGLWDQILALNWVRYNIHDYGGNPRDVTIFGESAGGTSVSLLALIPNNRGLFHRVIIESGVATSTFATTNASLSTIRIAKKVGCVNNELFSNDITSLRCLRNVDPMTLVNATSEFTSELGLLELSFPPFAPVVDGELLRREPALLLQDKSSSEFTFFQSLDVMIGNCGTEGSVLLNIFQALQNDLKFNISIGIPTRVMCNTILPNILSKNIISNDMVFKTVCEKYTVKEDVAEQGRQLLDLVGDYVFIKPSISTLLDHSNNIQGTSTYQYMFFDENSFLVSKAPSWYRGSAHGTEISYLFFYEQFSTGMEFSEGAEILVNQMRSYWTNFAKTGNPNGPGLPVWLPYDRNSSHPYMSLRSLNTGMGLDYRKDYMEFWMNKIPTILSNCDQNSCALPVVGMGSTGSLMYVFTILLVSSQCIFHIKAEQSEIEIQTRLGSVIGVRHNDFMNKGIIYKFLNIPYGKAPIGHLRFQKPQQFGAWSETLNATRLGAVCYQSQNQSTTFPRFTEDCLKLNIYVPNNINSSNNKSVMVWIHGGAFMVGSGGMYDGSMLSLVGDVIVVTINYRLGIFGFFASRNNKAKGNAGLWDQKMALNWVRYNIKDYGGNPDDVTIFGESAGGSSVALQSLIPSNRGLFHRVIAQSGTANSYLAVSNATLSSIAIGKKVGCAYNYHSGNDQSFIECLRAVDASVLVKAMNLVWMDLGLNALVKLPFSPTVDGELIRKDPVHLLTDKSSPEFNFFQSLDTMIGICDNDGSLAISFLPFYQSKLNFNISEGVPTSEMCNTILPVFSKSLFNNSSDVSNAICKKYSAVNNIEEQGRAFLHMYGDITFIAPAALALEYHANSIQGTSTYQYVFSDELPSILPTAPSWYRGSAHATDVFYLFLYEQVKNVTKWPSGADILVNQMRQYWANFAKTGNPNGRSLPHWDPFDESALRPYMNLQSLMTSMGTNYRKTYIDFWNNGLSNIMQNGCNLKSCVMPVVG